jgi:sugar phosphate isomerase/epimerase
MKLHSPLLAVLVGLFARLPLCLAAADDVAPPNPLFVMDNGLNDEAHRMLEAKAALLQELGYDGVGWRPGQVPEMRLELAQRNLRMFSFYVGARIGTDEEPFDPSLPEMMAELEGSGAMIWLYVTSNQDPPSSPAGDQRAVKVVRDLADHAAKVGLKVALYPHHAHWLERVQDAVRLARKVDRPNVGVTFNLCHCLRVGEEPRIPELLREAQPYLFLVSINGADSDGENWGSLIQTLDQGTFDQLSLLRELRAIRYDGPIGLQCYGIPGSVRDNLTRSMKTWKQLRKQL